MDILSTFQTDGSTGSAPTALCMVGGGIATVGEDFILRKYGEGTISMGKKFHRSTHRHHRRRDRPPPPPEPPIKMVGSPAVA